MRGKRRFRKAGDAGTAKRRIPLSKGQNLLATAVLALYALAMLALALAPVSLAGRSVTAWAAVGTDASRALSYGNTYLRTSPFSWMALYLNAAGVRPRRVPWKTTGVDYGNTRIPKGADADPIAMTWDYRPLTLEAVPDGVDVLAPTWFYVQDGEDGAEVVDLAHLTEKKITGWQPEQYVTKAHEGDAKVWGVVVSFDPDLSKQIVTDEERQAVFLQRLAGWVEAYHLDGINFDFEKMDPDDAEAFTALIAAANKALPEDKVVSVCVTVPLDRESPDNWWQCYDRKGLGVAADYVAMMAYDSAEPGPVAPIDWVHSRLRVALDQVPAEKLLLGIPFYGADLVFDTAAVADEALPADGDAEDSRTMLPSQLAKLESSGSYSSGGKKQAVEQWIDRGTWQDELGMTRYAFLATDNKLHVVYCEDADSIELKAGLLWYNRVAGAAVWRAGFGTDTLWRALGAGLNPQ